ncbi:peptidoglycan-binding protein [Sinorhizobium meliloti]|nr:peptidoglycan-binding protein [Sinorhizobium meliloti]
MILVRASQCIFRVASTACLTGLLCVANLARADDIPNSKAIIQLDNAYDDISIGNGRIYAWNLSSGEIDEVAYEPEVRVNNIIQNAAPYGRIESVSTERESGDIYFLSRGRKDSKGSPLLVGRIGKGAGVAAPLLNLEESTGRPQIYAYKRDADTVLVVYDELSSLLTVIRNPDLWRNETVRRAQFKNENIFLGRGSIERIVTSEDGQYLVAYHSDDQTQTFSFVDLDEPSVVFKHVPLFSGRIKEPALLQFKVSDGDAFVLYSVAGRFLQIVSLDRNFNRLIEKSFWQLSGLPNSLVDKSAVTRTSSSLSVIVSGSANSTELAIMSLLRNDRFSSNILMGPYLVKRLPEIRAFAVSEDGSRMAILYDRGSKVAIVENPIEWAKGLDGRPRSDEVEDVQVLLTELFETVPADGIKGPQTDQALRRVKNLMGLPNLSEIDQVTLNALRQVKSERDPEYPNQEFTESERCEYNGQLTTFCITNKDKYKPIQVDYYLSNSSGEKIYQASQLHSCAFIKASFPGSNTCKISDVE